MPDPATEDAPADEAEQVYRWRFEQFIRLHFDPSEAEILATVEADWHRAETLLIVCPRRLVFEILS